MLKFFKDRNKLLKINTLSQRRANFIPNTHFTCTSLFISTTYFTPTIHMNTQWPISPRKNAFNLTTHFTRTTYFTTNCPYHTNSIQSEQFGAILQSLGATRKLMKAIRKFLETIRKLIGAIWKLLGATWTLIRTSRMLLGIIRSYYKDTPSYTPSLHHFSFAYACLFYCKTCSITYFF